MTNKRRYSVSKGNAGEQAAEIWFTVRGWRMIRTQPETRVIKRNGRPVVIQCGNGGVADYTGYTTVDSPVPHYIACEVKTAIGNTMPASRLTKRQRDWMLSIPAQCRYVLIVWPNECEVFRFIDRGSYKRGEGTI